MSAEEEFKKALEEARKKSEEFVNQVLKRVEEVVREIADYAEKENPEARKALLEMQGGGMDLKSAEGVLKKLKKEGGEREEGG